MAEYVSDVLPHSRKRAPIAHLVSFGFVFWTFRGPCNPQTFAPSKAYGANRIIDSPNVLKWCIYMPDCLFWLNIGVPSAAGKRESCVNLSMQASKPPIIYPNALVTQETAEYPIIRARYVFSEDTHNETPLHQTWTSLTFQCPSYVIFCLRCCDFPCDS
jgi:hypothetical protein